MKVFGSTASPREFYPFPKGVSPHFHVPPFRHLETESYDFKQWLDEMDDQPATLHLFYGGWCCIWSRDSTCYFHARKNIGIKCGHLQNRVKGHSGYGMSMYLYLKHIYLLMARDVDFKCSFIHPRGSWGIIVLFAQMMHLLTLPSGENPYMCNFHDKISLLPFISSPKPLLLSLLFQFLTLFAIFP